MIQVRLDDEFEAKVWEIQKSTIRDRLKDSRWANRDNMGPTTSRLRDQQI
jgi:hypothetical protein